jgi:hypothetical protein
MARPDYESTPEIRFRRRRHFAAALSLFFLLLLLILAGSFLIFYPQGSIMSAVGQPIPFSHRVHATDKQISCFMCHSNAIKTDHAGLPPEETCMLCHKRIAIHYPPIVRLTNYYNDSTPIRWNRVNDLPDFVYFSHQSHILAGFDCGKCHGDVATMDRVLYVNQFTMGFCITCHKEQNASHDCFICHR